MAPLFERVDNVHGMVNCLLKRQSGIALDHRAQFRQCFNAQVVIVTRLYAGIQQGPAFCGQSTSCPSTPCLYTVVPQGPMTTLVPLPGGLLWYTLLAYQYSTSPGYGDIDPRLASGCWALPTNMTSPPLPQVMMLVRILMAQGVRKRALSLLVGVSQPSLCRIDTNVEARFSGHAFWSPCP